MLTVRLIDDLADSTAVRDHDDLDGCVAQLLGQYFSASDIAQYRVVREGVQTQLLRQVTRPDGAPAPAEAPCLLDARDPSALHQCVVTRRTCQSLTGPAAHLAAFPSLSSRGETEAVLTIQSPAPLAPKELLLVQGILRLIGNHRALLDYGQRDTLTGLLNRKTFEAQFDKLRQQLVGERHSAASRGWLALIDIDRFKSINDRHGHLFGDEVLLLVAQLMRQALRGSDYLYRFGGEEFVLLLHGIGEPAAERILERVRASIEAYEFPQVGRVTVSLGWTALADADSPTTCLERADSALYTAKNAGRNRCCRYRAQSSALAPQDSLIELF